MFLAGETSVGTMGHLEAILLRHAVGGHRIGVRVTRLAACFEIDRWVFEMDCQRGAIGSVGVSFDFGSSRGGWREISRVQQGRQCHKMGR